jgi:IS5 family transposase
LFQHAFQHERSDLRLGDKLELLPAESLRVAHKARGGSRGG